MNRNSTTSLVICILCLIVDVLVTPADDNDDGEAQLQRLDRALSNLRLAHPRAARIIDLRIFAGKSVEETAESLSIGTGTVKRDFAFAKSFLLADLESQQSG